MVTLANVMVVLMFCVLSCLAYSSAAAAAACWAAVAVHEAAWAQGMVG